LPREPRAPIAILSAARRNALVACFNAGELTKRNGAWHGLLNGKPTSGVTIADLARDGMLTLTTDSRVVSARLTEQGHWYARTLLCENDADMPRKRMTKTSDGSISACCFKRNVSTEHRVPTHFGKVELVLKELFASRLGQIQSIEIKTSKVADQLTAIANVMNTFTANVSQVEVRQSVEERVIKTAFGFHETEAKKSPIAVPAVLDFPLVWLPLWDSDIPCP
jgi:hypothetical protein